MVSMDFLSLVLLAGMMLLRVLAPVTLLFVIGALANRQNPAAS